MSCLLDKLVSLGDKGILMISLIFSLLHILMALVMGIFLDLAGANEPYKGAIWVVFLMISSVLLLGFLSM